MNVIACVLKLWDKILTSTVLQWWLSQVRETKASSVIVIIK